MMNIKKEKCIGCGLCVNDCFIKDIELIDGKANMKNIACFKCGHCIAICPKNAVSTDEYNMEEVKEYNKDDFTIDSDQLLNFIKFRRTIRHFKNKDVENDKLVKIIDAGRFTQTASNSQNVSYIVVKEDIDKLKAIALEALSEQGQTIISNLNPQTMFLERYANMWIGMNEAYKEKGEDNLFFHAPAVILVVSDSEVNAALASTNMELMTNALGLGTFYSGFFVRASRANNKIMTHLELDETKQIVTCMVIGYPDVKYVRTVPRKDAAITWK